MYTQLEDEFGDIVGKARRGQEMESVDVAGKVGLALEDLGRIEDWTRIEVSCCPQCRLEHPILQI